MDVRGASESRRAPQRLRAHQVSFRVNGDAPGEKLRDVVERAKARSAVYDIVTTASRSRSSSSRAESGQGGRGPAARRDPIIDMSELTAKTEPGARLMASLRRSPRTSRPRRAPRPRGVVSPRGHRRAQARGLLRRADPRRARRPRRHVGARRCRRFEPARPRRRVVAIGVNMHLIILMNIVRRWQFAVGAGDERRAEIFAASMRSIARDGVVIAAAISELGQDLTRPQTRATRTPSAGASTGARRSARCHRPPPCSSPRSPSSTTRASSATATPRSPPTPAASRSTATGTRWDARLGQPLGHLRRGRASRAALRGGFPAATGRLHRAQPRRRPLPCLGLAGHRGERRGGGDRTSRPAGEPDARARTLLAENAIELGAAPGDALACGHARRELRRRSRPRCSPRHRLAKSFVNEAAARIVDRRCPSRAARGYLNGHPLSRAYRDVRAGAFMHPLGANRAYEFARRRRARARAALH